MRKKFFKQIVFGSMWKLMNNIRLQGLINSTLYKNEVCIAHHILHCCAMHTKYSVQLMLYMVCSAHLIRKVCAMNKFI